MYTYCGNNPTNFIDPMGLCKERGFGRRLWEGDYFGTQYGASSTDRWAERAVASKTLYGKAGNYFMGGLSALWTPETYRQTAVTLGSAWFGARASAPKGINTPYGKAVQENSKAALRVQGNLKQGATAYKAGVLGRSETGASQFLAAENPLNAGYAARYGIPPQNANFNFVLTGRVREGAAIVSRSAPGISTNSGGGIEAVINEGDFIIDSFFMP